MALSQTQKTLFWLDGIPVVGSTTVGYNTGASQLFGGTSQQEPPALGDVMQFTVNLDPGDYQLSVTSIHAQFSAIHEFRLDGLLLGAFDNYSSTFDFNIVETMPVTIINQSSILTSTVIGKDPASGDFYIAVSRMYFRQL